MAAENELAIVLTVIADSLKAGLAAASEAVATWGAEVKTQLAEVGEAGEGLGKMFAGLGEAFAAKEIIGGLAELAVKATEAREPMEVAEQVAHNLGHAFDGASAEGFLEGLATSGKAGSASIQDLRGGMQILAQVTNSQAQAERASVIVTQLMAARHMDYGTALSIVTKVLTGHVALLGRYGFATKDAAGKTLGTAAAMEMLDKSTKHAADVVGAELPAQLVQLGSRFSLLSESVGALLVPALLAIVEVGDRVVDWLRGMSPQALETIAAVAGLVAAFLSALAVATLLAAIAVPLAAGFAALTGPIGIVIAIVAVLAAGALYLATHWQEAGALMRTVWAAIQSAVAAASAFLIARWHDLGEVISGLGELFHWLGDAVRAVCAMMVADVHALVQFEIDRFNDMDRALGGTGDAWADFAGAVAHVCQGILSVVGAMVRAAIGLLQGLARALGSIVGTIGRAISGFAGGVSSAILAKMDPKMRDGLARVVAGTKSFVGGMADAGKGLGTGFVNGLVGAVHAGESAIAGAGKFVADIFKRHALPGAGATTPTVPFDNAPGEAAKGGKGKKGAGAGDKPLDVDGVKEQLDAARAAIAAVLESASDDVDRAKAGLEAATANLDAYKASIGGKVTNADQAAHEQALITAEMEKQKAVATAIAAQKKATEVAAAEEGAIASRLTAAAAAQLRTTTAAVDVANRLTKAHSAAGEAARKTAAAQIGAYKTLSDEAATFLTAQGKHTTEAINLGAALSRAGIVLSDLIKAMKEPGIELADLQDKAADARAKIQQAAVASTLDAGEAGIKGTEDTDRHQDDMEKARGKDKSPVRQDQDDLKTAKLDEQLEELRLTAAKASAGIAIYTATLKLANANASGDASKIAAAQEALTLAQTDGAAKIAVASTNVQTAFNNVAVATTKLATDTAANTFSLTSALTTMAQKVVALIPGLSMNSTGAMLFNWQAMLGAALEKTQAYAKIQQVVNQLMNLFAQIIDKLMPLIDVLLNIITAVANAFVALWNIVAKLLSLIGIQIGDLTDLNNGLVPLISVVHNIPTLNELAAGKTKSPLSQNPVAVNAPVVNALKSPGLGGGIFSKLVELALVLVVIHLVLLHHTISTQTQLQQANTSLTQIAANTQAMAASGGGGGGGLGGLMGMMGPWGMAAAAAVGVIGMLASSGSGSNDSSDNGDNPQNENGGTIVVGDGSGGQNAPGLNQLTGTAAAAAAAAAAAYVRSQEFAAALQSTSVVAAAAAIAASAATAMGKSKDATSRKAAAVLGSLGSAQSAASGAIDNSKRTNVSSTLTMGDINVRNDADLAALQASLALFTINTDITGRYSLGRVTT